MSHCRLGNHYLSHGCQDVGCSVQCAVCSSSGLSHKLRSPGAFKIFFLGGGFHLENLHQFCWAPRLQPRFFWQAVKARAVSVTKHESIHFTLKIHQRNVGIRNQPLKGIAYIYYYYCFYIQYYLCFIFFNSFINWITLCNYVCNCVHYTYAYILYICGGSHICRANQDPKSYSC